MADFKEVAYDNLDCDPFGTLCATQRGWITKINKLKKKYPNEVIIKKENSDGSLIVQIPKSWFKITPTRKQSPEAKAKIVKHLKAGREAKSAD